MEAETRTGLHKNMPHTDDTHALLVPPASNPEQHRHQLGVPAHRGTGYKQFTWLEILHPTIAQAGTQETMARCNQWIALLGFAPNMLVLLSGRRPARLAGKQFMPGFEEEDKVPVNKASHCRRAVETSAVDVPARGFNVLGVQTLGSSHALYHGSAKPDVYVE
jgi:hypothetical protein